MPDVDTDRPSASAPASLRFGPAGRFELQPGERRLLVDGRPAAIGSRTLDLLIVLAARPDRLMSKNELLDKAWPGLVVEEANLHVQISHVRKLLGSDVIATVPGRGYRFVAVVETGGGAAAPAAPSASAASTTTVEAPRVRLVGRDADLARLEALLQAPGCVTLVGTSGVGKTSLARAAAGRRGGRSVWVDLASLVQASQVAPALARALDVQLEGSDPLSPLLRALRSAPALVVLDNAEHLVEACAELAARLCGVTETTLLVTSQMPLSIAVERVQRLEPLSISTAAGTDGDGDGDAMALLADRIAALDQRFVPSPATRPVLAEICAHLDGLPLALEMAAARVPTLGLTGVRDALNERFSLLTRGHRNAAARHRTLHHALDWSYSLLSAEEQRQFRALGVFAGGFTLDLAAAVLVGENGADDEQRWAAIDGLAALVDRSLVTVSAGDPPRYRLLETLRAFALEQLAQAVSLDNEEADVRRRHALAVTTLLERWKPVDATVQALCVAEMENAREAVAWARVNDLGLAARLTAAATPPATFTAWRHEATQWLQALEPAMQQPEALALPASVRATWWLELARSFVMRRDARAGAVAKRAFEPWQPLDRPRRALFAAATWVRAVPGPGPELDAACAALVAQAAAIASPTPSDRLQAQAALVVAARTRGDNAVVLAGRLEESRLAEEAGSTAWADAAESNVLAALLSLDRDAEAAERGLVLLARIDARGGPVSGNLPWVFSGLLEGLAVVGRLAEAEALLPRVKASCGSQALPVVLPAIALVFTCQGRFEDAAHLLGHVREDAERRGLTLESDEERTLARLQALSVAALAPERMAALVDEGRRWDDKAVEQCLWRPVVAAG